jgi:hypothetical protein
VISLAGNRIARLSVKRFVRLIDMRGLAATPVGTAPGIPVVMRASTFVREIVKNN